jgi:hypothetical protein
MNALAIQTALVCRPSPNRTRARKQLLQCERPMAHRAHSDRQKAESCGPSHEHAPLGDLRRRLAAARAPRFGRVAK